MKARPRNQAITRRTIMGAAFGTLAGQIAIPTVQTMGAHKNVGFSQVDQSPVEDLIVDIPIEPARLDPASVYRANDWSIVHSVYDSLLQYGPQGQLMPLLAESFELLDPLTLEFRLREGVAFHNGDHFDSDSVIAAVGHVTQPTSQAVDHFSVIDSVKQMESHLVQIRLHEPAPWLPSVITAWLVMLPPNVEDSQLLTAPVGTGPYRFESWDRGNAITLTANLDYFDESPKGKALASQVEYRFIPEASTRITDILTGAADIATEIAPNLLVGTDGNKAAPLSYPIAGSSWIRIATDTPPFDDIRVRQALNHAVDVDSIVEALSGGYGKRLANFFSGPETIGFDPALAPYSYDVDRARSLLAAAGLSGGFSTVMEYAAGESGEIVTAIAGFWEDVGIDAEVRVVDGTTFNASWGDRDAAPLRYATWRPLFDPHNLLSLVVSENGVLSRHSNRSVQALIEQGSSESNPSARKRIYQEAGRLLRDEPAAVYLSNLFAHYCVREDTPKWIQRPDEYLLLMK